MNAGPLAARFPTSTAMVLSICTWQIITTFPTTIIAFAPKGAAVYSSTAVQRLLTACRMSHTKNRGDGTFVDVTLQVGLHSDAGKELGVVFGDVDLDGDTDLYLANDKTLNFLYLNDGRGQFEEMGLLAGTAYNEDGDVEAGMGVDMGDYDNDRYPDLFVTNFQWETNTLYKNLGDGTFVDETFLAGLGKGSIPYLSWGTRFFDYDSDGDRDVFIANGHLESDVESYENATFAQRNQLLKTWATAALKSVNL